VFGGGLEFVGAPGLDLVAQRRALAIGDRHSTGEGARLSSALVSIVTFENPALARSLRISRMS
jgi:hypothetical protein